MLECVELFNCCLWMSECACVKVKVRERARMDVWVSSQQRSPAVLCHAGPKREGLWWMAVVFIPAHLRGLFLEELMTTMLLTSYPSKTSEWVSESPLGSTSLHFSISSLSCSQSVRLPSVFHPLVSFSAHGASSNRQLSHPPCNSWVDQHWSLTY